MSASDMRTDDFAAFFRAVHRVDPFPWQQRLLEKVVADEGVWPDVLSLPTGAGKTAAIDIAVFHLALEASRGTDRCAPVRIAFVVDRRLIVDDAYTRACKLAEALANPADPTVLRIAAALRRLAGEGQRPLLVRRLRGGMPREDDWARTPVQPTVLCSTVDQVGSRLLFRGYGVSDRMKPVHAGLIGSDCLILLDEAHLSQPFRQTLAAVARLRRPDEAPWGVALLTATPGQEAEPPFCLSEKDRADPLLARRLGASKPARLVEITGRQEVSTEDRRVEALAEAAKASLDALKKSGIAHPAIGVVVNRVLRARAVFERLRNALSDCAVTLVIGPARTIDRAERAGELDQIRTDAPRILDKPLIVVATQTIEVGVDIDLDGLVTEAAALDALRQRFGRLNRAGRPIAPVGAILAGKEDIGAKAEDPVYGAAAAATWKELQVLAAAETTVDFGIDAFDGRLTPKRIAALAAPQADAPVLLPAYADLWSHTSPIPNADPEVALFLHGPARSPASVQLVWRADIDERDLLPAERERLIDLFALVPPRAGEAIEVPLWTARAWLRRKGDEPPADFSDTTERRPDRDDSARGRPAFRYAGADRTATGRVFAGEIHPGDLLVVPAEYGGCDEWGWNPNSRDPVRDVAETAALPYASRRFAVRVSTELIRQYATAEEGAEAERAAARLPEVLAECRDERNAAVLLDAVLGLTIPQDLRAQLERLRDRRGRLEPRWVYGHDEEGRPRGVVLVAPFGLKKAPRAEEEAAPPATESDDLGATPGYAQPLDEHSCEVRDYAAAFADKAGLPAGLAADVALAAYLHDAGKLDPRYQAYLSGGNPLGWDGQHVLAKSGKPFLPRDAWKRAGLPDDHWRHEALSVRLAQLHKEFTKAHDPVLVLWLIGVHHGFGRPFFPHADPCDRKSRKLPRALDTDWSLAPGAGPQSLAFAFDGRDWPQIFEDLKQCYGIWGLARLEAFVRLADHRASEEAGRHHAEMQSDETSQ
ncbi:MAG: type I-G CRISPR-associated helicase/endonuclease Cas3g [Stellaceae bacterium]